MTQSIGLDLGSTSIKAGLLDVRGQLSNIVTHPAPKVLAQDGRFESDALAYASLADQVLNECAAQAEGKLDLGLCSQRSSFLIWERDTGKPITPLISWQDNRGAESCVALQAHQPIISALSGLRLTPYFFAPKLRVMLNENPHWLKSLENGEYLVGTLDTFLIWRWTSGKLHMCDASMAARTLLMDIHKQQWSPALCELFGIPINILPIIKPSTQLNITLNNDLTLQASLGDQSAALVASVGQERDTALVNLGTGGFVIRYLADDQKNTLAGYLRTLVYQDSQGGSHIAVEGTLNSIAAALANYPVAECKSENMAEFKNIYSLAEPSGLGAPYFRADVGLHFSQPVAHLTQTQIACLLLEAIVFRVSRIVEDFNWDTPIKRIYLSGGLSELHILQQSIAQCVHCDVFRLKQKDASLQGAALLASERKYVQQNDVEKILVTMNNQAIKEKYLHWKNWLDGLLER